MQITMHFSKKNLKTTFLSVSDDSEYLRFFAWNTFPSKTSQVPGVLVKHDHKIEWYYRQSFQIEAIWSHVRRTLESQASSHAGVRACWPETYTRAVKLDLTSLMIACYRIKCFPGARRSILVIGLIEIRARLYVTCWEWKLEVNYMWDLIIQEQKVGIFCTCTICIFTKTL